jgi:hypothetical protein
MDEVLFPIYGYGGTVDNEWYQWHKIFDKINTDDDIYGDYLDDPTYSIIILKTCFPQSNLYGGVGGPSDTLTIYMDRTVYGSKWHLRSIIKKMEYYPNKFFVIWTNIPLLEENTTPTEAGYVNWFCTWAKDTLAAGLDATYGAFPPNVYVFDYFHLIDSLNFMPPWLADGEQNKEHPSPYQNAIVDPVFVQETFDAALAYKILPVELTSFTSKLLDDKIQLNWVTKTEVNNYGFNVERRINEGEWNSIGFLEGHGNSNSPKEYSYSDKDLFAGGSKFQYKLKQVDNDGSFEYSDVVEVEVVPNQYELPQNFPNPFNPSTTIRFSLPQATRLKINVYNMLGELVEKIAEGSYETGYHKVIFNASNLSSGIYIYRLESENFIQTKKMVLIK